MNSFPRRSLMIWAAAGLLMCSPRLIASDSWISRLGLGALTHPLQLPDGPLAPAGTVSPTCGCSNDHVYVFAVNGMDPFCLSNFNGLCEYLREQGFANTYFGQLLSCSNFPGQIREIRRSDPEAHIVLIGFSCGCDVVKGMANSLDKDGTRIDLLVYLAGDYITNKPSSYPSNVGSVLNIRAKGYLLSGGSLFFCGADIDGARNCKLDVRHMSAPSQRETLEVLLEEMHSLTCIPDAAVKAKTAVAQGQPASQSITQAGLKLETSAAQAEALHTVRKVETIAGLAGAVNQTTSHTIRKVDTIAGLAGAGNQPTTHTVRRLAITDQAEESPVSVLRIP